MKDNNTRKKKDTLVIIGNGFDRWQNLNTSYSGFQKYYLEHRDEILKKLKLKKIKIYDQDGFLYDISDVELIYGNPFHSAHLEDDFWWRFEDSLSIIDASRINSFFGKEKNELKEMAKSVANAKKILMTAFASWIRQIEIGEEDSGMRFGENCYFINFNYTSTLENRFSVNSNDIYHIHGEANDPKSIIVGHTIHPQEPIQELYKMGGRFRGLFLIECILHQTDKHVGDNITLLSMVMALSGIRAEDIKDIYVLGHSFGDMDIEYFKFLNKATSVNSGKENSNVYEEMLIANYEKYCDPLDDFQNRVQYVIKRYGYDETLAETILPEEELAIRIKTLEEQEERNRVLEKDFMKMLRRASIKKLWGRMFKGKNKVSDENIIGENPTKRIQNAMWHITYFSSEDETRIKKAMGEIGCSQYELISSIDDAISPLMTFQ